MLISKIIRPILAALLGIIAFFVLAEATIRIVGYIQTYRETKNLSDGPRIVFLGNSHTYGYGVPKGKAYSFVLQDFFQQERPDVKINMINEGLLNGNTTVIYQNLDAIFKRSHPELILMMAGEPNIWNKDGYSDYLSGQKKLSKEEEESLARRKFLERSRIIRWLYLLPKFREEEKLSTDQENEYDAYRYLASMDDATSLQEMSKEEATKVRSTILRFLDRHKKETLSNYRSFLIILAKLDWDVFLKQKQAIAFLSRSVDYDPKLFDFYTFFTLSRFLTSTKDDEFIKLLHELKMKAEKSRPPEEVYQRQTNVLNHSVVPTNPSKEHIADLEALLKMAPTAPLVVRDLAFIYEKKREYGKLVDVIKNLLITNPLQNRTHDIYLFPEMQGTRNSANEIKAIADKARLDFIDKFPLEAYRFDANQDKILRDWIVWDTERIVDKVESQGSKLVIQSYHWIRDRREWSAVKAASEMAAKKKDNPFLDTNAIFMKEIQASGNENSFFITTSTPNDSHPSEKGHRLIARIIYDYLNEKKLLPAELLGLNARKIYTYKWEN